MREQVAQKRKDPHHDASVVVEPARGGPVGEFTHLPLASLVESPTNPRRCLEPRGIEELAENIRQHGVLVPLIVRPCNGQADQYEILAGHRRYRAARQAGLGDVPVRVLHLSDEAALAVQIIDNLQRQDVHPLDEALGFRALLEEANHDIEKIAAKVSKSPVYVQRRLKLADLIKKAQTAFYNGTITLSHAELISRLQPADQEKALDQCVQTEWLGQGRKEAKVAISVPRLRHWIETNLMLNLHSAPWKKDDATLVPEAGPCFGCFKRTGNSKLLFDDITSDNVCTDPTCFNRKLEAFCARKTLELTTKGETVLQLTTRNYTSKKEMPAGVVPAREVTPVGKQPCEHTVMGLYLDGNERGQTKKVCPNSACKIHGTNRFRYTPSPEEQRQRKEQNRKKKLEHLRTRRLWEAIAQRITEPLAPEDWRRIAERFLWEMPHDTQKKLFKMLGWPAKRTSYGGLDFQTPAKAQIEAMSELELGRFLLLLCAVPEIEPSPYYQAKDSTLLALADRFGIDAAAIGAQVRAELSDKRKAKKKTETQDQKKKPDKEKKPSKRTK